MIMEQAYTHAKVMKSGNVREMAMMNYERQNFNYLVNYFKRFEFHIIDWSILQITYLGLLYTWSLM